MSADYGGIQVVVLGKSPSKKKRIFQILKKKVDIGSDKHCSIVVLKGDAAPHHARLEVDEHSRVWLNNVSNGKVVTLNSIEIKERVKLNEGDIIGLAGRAFRFLAPASTSVSVSTDLVNNSKADKVRKTDRVNPLSKADKEATNKRNVSANENNGDNAKLESENAGNNSHVVSRSDQKENNGGAKRDTEIEMNGVHEDNNHENDTKSKKKQEDNEVESGRDKSYTRQTGPSPKKPVEETSQSLDVIDFDYGRRTVGGGSTEMYEDSVIEKKPKKRKMFHSVAKNKEEKSKEIDEFDDTKIDKGSSEKQTDEEENEGKKEKRKFSEVLVPISPLDLKLKRLQRTAGRKTINYKRSWRKVVEDPDENVIDEDVEEMKETENQDSEELEEDKKSGEESSDDAESVDTGDEDGPIFEGLCFFDTGLQDKEVRTIVTKNGGTWFPELNLVLNHLSKVSPKRTEVQKKLILLASKCTTTAKTLLPYEDYLLPAGESRLDDMEIDQRSLWGRTIQPFSGERIELHLFEMKNPQEQRNFFKHILEECGAKVTRRLTSSDIVSVDFMLQFGGVEASPYKPCPPRSRKMDMQHFAELHNIPVVTIKWLIECFLQCSVVRHDAHPEFSFRRLDQGGGVEPTMGIEKRSRESVKKLSIGDQKRKSRTSAKNSNGDGGEYSNKEKKTSVRSRKGNVSRQLFNEKRSRTIKRRRAEEPEEDFRKHLLPAKIKTFKKQRMEFIPKKSMMEMKKRAFKEDIKVDDNVDTIPEDQSIEFGNLDIKDDDIIDDAAEEDFPKSQDITTYTYMAKMRGILDDTTIDPIVCDSEDDSDNEKPNSVVDDIVDSCDVVEYEAGQQKENSEQKDKVLVERSVTTDKERKKNVTWKDEGDEFNDISCLYESSQLSPADRKKNEALQVKGEVSNSKTPEECYSILHQLYSK